jgi:hypothetical protein
VSLLAIGCKGSTAPAPPFTTLAGQWSTQDTFRYSFAWISDGSPRWHTLIDQYTASVVTTSDSTYTFQWVAGFAQVFDSAEGQPAVRSTNPVIGSSLLFPAVVRGDTVVLQAFGRMLLTRATASSVISERTLPTSECLVALGPMARPTPTPSCYVGYHWTRTQ